MKIHSSSNTLFRMVRLRWVYDIELCDFLKYMPKSHKRVQNSHLSGAEPRYYGSNPFSCFKNAATFCLSFV